MMSIGKPCPACRQHPTCIISIARCLDGSWLTRLACSCCEGYHIEYAGCPAHDPQGSGQALKGGRSIIERQALRQVGLHGLSTPPQRRAAVPIAHPADSLHTLNLPQMPYATSAA